MYNLLIIYLNKDFNICKMFVLGYDNNLYVFSSFFLEAKKGTTLPQ